MNLTRTVISAITLASAAASAQAQFVKGNEAVKVLPNGTRVVETPPLPPRITLPAPCKAEKPECAMGGWLMVETRNGLQECTEIYARPGSCRASTYGAVKEPRRWIVKLKGQWMQCQRPDISSICISTKSLPTTLIQ